MRSRLAFILLTALLFSLMLMSCHSGKNAPAGAVDQVRSRMDFVYGQTGRVEDFKVTFAAKMELTDVDRRNGIDELWCLAGTLSRQAGPASKWEAETFQELVELRANSWRKSYDNAQAERKCYEMSSRAVQ